MNDFTLSRRQAGEILGVSYSYIRKLESAKTLHPRRGDGGVVLHSRSEVAALAKERAAAHREGQGPGAGPVQPEVHAGFGVDGRAVIIDSEVARPLIAARVRIEEEAADRRRQEWHRQKWRRERLEMSIASLRTCLVTWVAPVVVALPAIWVASQVLSSLTDAKLAGPKWPFWLGQCAAHWALRMPTPPLPWLPPIWNGLAWVPPRPIQQGD